MRKLWLFPFLFAALLFTARPAHAQHFDASFNAGVSKRFFSGGSVGGSDGPLIGFTGDVALAPLVRIGVYADEELAYDGETKSPLVTSFGARMKLMPPLANDKLRLWAFVGIGYALIVAPGYSTTTQTADLPAGSPANLSSTTGTFFEVPFGVGGSYRLRAPWVLLGELSARAGFNSGGNYFESGGRPGTTVTNGESIGYNVATGESFALIFTVGIGIDL